ncbi:hypothetical protein [Sphaerisporangium sp. NPDC051011]|uniref:hypothetical protein n=1 Tax=Sphaerisporangium sp. NPDC051011 TaxID=3155792 RepID=UPI003408FED4
MFHQPAHQQPAFFSPARVLTPAEYGWDEERDRFFAEFIEPAGGCRFADCAHTTEPGCAVLAAVESGRLTRRRLDGYRRLLRENAYAASRTDARLRAERERPKKDIARLRRAINRSSHRKA